MSVYLQYPDDWIGVPPFDEGASHVMTLRATYAFEVAGGFFRLGTATTDLVGIKRFREQFAELAATVSEQRL